MLLDTSGLFALADRREPAHPAAVGHYESAATRLTHSYVLAEFVALANARRFDRRDALAFVAELADDPGIEVVWVGETLHRDAVALLIARQDKSYSLCDAVSFVLMRRRGMSDALTTDHHFEQEGFRRLLP